MNDNNLGLYIHIPFCKSKCSYCDFVSFADSTTLHKHYIDMLLNEMDNVFDEFRDGEKRVVDTIFIGGGTPSVLYKGALKQLKNHIFNSGAFHFVKDLEFTVEANPESCNEGFVKECVQIGVNRLSLGLQSSHDRLLKDLRQHSFDDFIKAVSLARKYKIHNINADIMLGLPFQTIEDVLNTIDELIKLDMHHISMYGLKIEEGTLLYNSGYEPDEDMTAQMYMSAYDRLKAVGYLRYEVSNFAKKGFECRHNKKYWRLDDYIGVGLNASSLYNGVRKKNTYNMNQYLKGDFLSELEDADNNFLTEYLMLGLRTTEGIDLGLLKLKGINLFKNEKLYHFINNGIMIMRNNRLKIADEYYYVMNSIISELI